VTDPSGALTWFEYHAFTQVTKVVDPINGETTFTFLELAGPHPRSRALGGCAPRAGPQALDGNGYLLTLTDARNKTTTCPYDETVLSRRGARAKRVA
jgi:YD repeat-containing protein